MVAWNVSAECYVPTIGYVKLQDMKLSVRLATTKVGSPLSRVQSRFLYEKWRSAGSFPGQRLVMALTTKVKNLFSRNSLNIKANLEFILEENVFQLSLLSYVKFFD